jgi:uncharacterized protein YndB with AHSA1/START domain
MNKDLVVSKTIEINASAAKVWDALTNPAIIKQYLFGTEVVTDWKVGSEIVFQGSWEGKAYKDKGKIMKFDVEKVFQYTYWSGFSGLEDKEENYSLVTFEVNGDDIKTSLTLSQQGFANEQAKEHSEKSWDGVLQKIKELVENSK